jgi:hypothetical protein
MMNNAQAELLKYLAVLSGGAGLAGIASGIGLGAADPQQGAELNTISPEVVNVPMPKRKKPVPVGFKLASFPGWLMGNNSTYPWEIPLGPTAMIAGPLAAYYGARGLSKDITVGVRRAKMKREVDKAKQDYTNALLNAYPQDDLDVNTKAAQIDADLDKLAAHLKISENPIMVDAVDPTTPGMVDKAMSSIEHNTGIKGLGKGVDSAGKVLGNSLASLAILGGLTIPAGTSYAAYNFFRDRSKTKMLNEAARLRQYGRLQSNMPEIYVASGE